MDKVLIFIFDGMTDYEITFISHLLCADAGKEVITIAYEDKMIKGSSGLIYKPLKLVSDVLNEDVQGLIIPGGWYGDIKPELIKLINNLNLKGFAIEICDWFNLFESEEDKNNFYKSIKGL